MMWGWNYYDGSGWIAMTAVILLLVVMAIGMIGTLEGFREDKEGPSGVTDR
jgi:hypothetical protein